MESFYGSAFSAIHGIIPCERCSFNETNFHPARFLNSIGSSQEHKSFTGKFLPALNTYLHEHPLTPHLFSDKVQKTTDYATKKYFKTTAIYNEYYKHLDIETQMVLALPVSQEKILVLALSKKNPDFSERDRLVLTLLKPHLMNALRNAMEFGFMRLEKELMQKGAEAENQGVILFQQDGEMLCISPFAKEMLKKYFDATHVIGDTLPGNLLVWFKAEVFPGKAERAPLTLEKEDKCLKIKLYNDFTSGDFILVLAEMTPSLVSPNLQGYGLSCRETEILIWLSKGKTNSEIGMILSISKRTVEKHLENTFAKLGVETRAAAVAIMMQK